MISSIQDIPGYKAEPDNTSKEEESKEKKSKATEIIAILKKQNFDFSSFSKPVKITVWPQSSAFLEAREVKTPIELINLLSDEQFRECSTLEDRRDETLRRVSDIFSYFCDDSDID